MIDDVDNTVAGSHTQTEGLVPETNRAGDAPAPTAPGRDYFTPEVHGESPTGPSHTEVESHAEVPSNVEAPPHDVPVNERDPADGGQELHAGSSVELSASRSDAHSSDAASSRHARAEVHGDLHGPSETEEVSKDWYILKVQSNREESIRDGLMRRVKIAGLEHFFDEVIVPTEMVTEFKNGKKRVVKRKLYPGYLVVHMTINDDTWFLVRDTPGIGDFTGAGGHPVPMQAHEVARLLAKQEEKSTEAPKLKIGFKTGDRVKINEGTFENFEGDVDSIDEANGRVTVMINIFGRSTPVELEYWQVESI